MVSVIIPCYNSEAFVKRAIDSVLKQTHKDFELILVDNNSTDNTVAILEEYEATYPGLIRVFEEKKPGAPAARNKGLEEARGEWLQFLDSDDELMPDKLRHQVELTIDGNVDLVVGNCYQLKEGRNNSTMRIKRAITDNPWKALIASKLGNTCNNLWRREMVIAVGRWDEKMTSSDEYELLFRLLKKGARIRYFDEPETIVHTQDNSVNRSRDDRRLCEILDNFIDLRIAVQNYLARNGKLTKELKNTIAVTIANRLWPYEKRVPRYIKDKKAAIGLNVPISYTIKRRIKQLKKQTAGFLRKPPFKA